MTEYRNIYVDKRNFTILVHPPELSDTLHDMVLLDETYIERNGDTYIDRSGDTYIAHNTTAGYPRIINVKKRSFTVLVDKLNGS